MGRILIIAWLLIWLPSDGRTQPAVPSPAWETCLGAMGADGPALRDCRPVIGVIDPQGRELWLRSSVDRPQDDGPHAFYIGGVASSEVWLNGRRLGANGQPAPTASAEVPGRFQIAFPISETAWRASDNVVVVRLSSFHGGLRLDQPVGGLFVAPYPLPSPTALLALTFVAAGALFAAAFGFGVIHGLRRTTSSLILALIAAVAGLQAVLESLRSLFHYAYPVHAWRLVGIWGLAAAFSILLVSYVVLRFWPKTSRPVIGIATVAIALSGLAPGFDLKTGLALTIGVAVSAFVTVVAVYRRRPAARLTLGWLAIFLGVAVAFPEWLVDLSYFLLVAAFILPLLMAEVVRLGRDDRLREDALSRAASRPDCLTVASARGVERIPIREIVAVIGADDYVELRLTGGRSLLHAARLERLETDLPSSFVRVHRSVIASMDQVRGMERDGGRWRLMMNEGPPLPISRARVQTVRDKLEEPVLPELASA